jgi:PEP-CTERM motif
MKNNLRPLCLSLLAMGALSLNAQAADISNVQNTLSNLSYRLVDLNPNDGIAPAILWQSGELQGSTYTGINSYNYLYAEKPISEYINDGAIYGASPITTAPSVFGNTGTIPLESDYPSASGSITGSKLSTQASLSSDVVDSSVSQTGGYPYTYTTTQYNAETNTLDTYSVTNDRLDVNSRGTSFARIESTQAYLALTPNTMLIVEGDASASGTVNAGDAKARAASFASQYGTNASTPYNEVYGSAYGSSTVKLTFDEGALPFDLYDSEGNLVVVDRTSSMTNGGSSYATQSSTYEMSVSTSYGSEGRVYVGSGFWDPINELPADADGNVSFADGEHFSLALTNFSGQSRIAILNLATYASASQSQSSSAFTETRELISSVPYTVPTPNPTIPEPSTYTLMGLGLVGIVVAARRQRPTPKG